MTSVFDIIPRDIALRMICGEIELFNTEYYDTLFGYYLSEMPYGVAKARTGDPDQWILDRLEEELGVYA